MDKSTLRRIEEKTGVNFSSKWRQSQKYAESLQTPLDHLKKNLSKASKILLLDGKHVNILGESVCVHIAYDTVIGVIDYRIDDTENKTAYTYVLRRLRDLKYVPICVISDDHSRITPLLQEERIPHQLCIFHLLKSLNRMLTQGNKINSDIPVQYQVMYSRIKGVFKTKNIEDLPNRIDQFRKLQVCWKGKTHQFVLNWFWNKLANAVIGLSFEENVPRTNNLLENLNGQIEARLKTFRGVKSEDSLNKILKILFYLRKYK